ncbi:hypothetical protein IR148_11705 [Dysgonomonas mossii]|uniref:GIY-YIG nuclease family protein n=1 Tax=Dysgonomonas mossii TaxID=163665 RepID=A0A4Y9IM19_9BACT|nr:hypothetical protein [Dysgonomonas mossii]MBF0761710.1 hypothetical protein [Dysgonomonas mossii]TFU89346.1 hypothetical protein E4T88_11700 [Dysgonomonas mossii]
MFGYILNKYIQSDFFTFQLGESFEQKCNAPKDKCGIYLIYEVLNDCENLLYIGASGQRNADGTIKIRKGGMYDRLINGYHPNQFGFDIKNNNKRIKRKKQFPLMMKEFEIGMIKVYWWVTHDDKFNDFPTDIEGLITNRYKSEHYNKLPKWHQ